MINKQYQRLHLDGETIKDNIDFKKFLGGYFQDTNFFAVGWYKIKFPIYMNHITTWIMNSDMFTNRDGGKIVGIHV